MEIAAAALFTGTAAAGTAAAGAAAGTVAAGTAAAAASSTFAALQGAATVASAIATTFGAVSSYQQSQTQARFAGINARGEELAAQERALRIRREMVQQSARNRVAFAASGLDISSGGDIERALVRDADFETTLAETSGQIAAAGGRAQQSTIRARGATSLASGIARAGGQLAGYGMDVARRG